MFEKGTGVTVADAITKIQAANTGNDSLDLSLSELRYEVDNEGSLSIYLPGETDPYLASSTAVVSLCKEAQMPHSYYERVDHNLRETNLSRRLNMKARMRRIMLNHEKKIFRGVVPTQYTDIPHDVVLSGLNPDTILQPVNSQETEEIYLGAKSLQWRVVLEELQGYIKDSSPNYLGIHLSTSDLGDFYSVLPLIWRQVCSNGLIIGDTSSDSPYRASYRGLDQYVATGLVTSVADAWKGKSQVFADAISDMEQRKMSMKEVEEFLADVENLKVSKRFIASIQDLIQQKAQDTIDRWSLVNILTSEAQGLKPGDQYRVEAAVSVASNLSQKYLDSLTPTP